MASTQDPSIASGNPGGVLAPESPASQTCFEDESEDDSSIEYFSARPSQATKSIFLTSQTMA